MSIVVAGLRRDLLASLGVAVRCAIRDDAVSRRATELGSTRAAVAIEQALEDIADAIVAVGNAPTALLKIVELIWGDGSDRLS